jgi:hypothetical protein
MEMLLVITEAMEVDGLHILVISFLLAPEAVVQEIMVIEAMVEVVFLMEVMQEQV